MLLITIYIFVAVVAMIVVASSNNLVGGRVALAAIGVNALLSSFIAVQALAGHSFEWVLAGSSVTGAIPIRIDALSGWFIVINNLLVVLGTWYGQSYLQAYNKSVRAIRLQNIIIVLLHSTLVALCVVQNSMVFLILWEMMALSAFVLVIFEHEKANVIRAGINYLIQAHLCIVFLMIAFLLVATQTGSYDFKAITYFTAHNNTTMGSLLFVLLFIGFGLKAGFVPLHTWLPHAHPAAPSHVSGIMSGVLVKIGIFGILRMISIAQLNFLPLGLLVVALSSITALYGILNAAVQRDYKRMLAYCTIENIGIIGIGIGVGMIGIGNHSSILQLLGFGAALLHVLNHALFKSLLFFSAGAVYSQTHTRLMDNLGGLIGAMPRTAFVFLIGALAIGGLPPFNGFVSEYLLYNGLLAGMKSGALSQTGMMVVALVAMSLVGGLSLLTFAKTFSTVFLGTARKPLHEPPHEVRLAMLLPQYLIIALMLAVAFYPQFFVALQVGIVKSITGNSVQEFSASFSRYAQNLAHIQYAFLLFVALAGAIYFFRTKLATRRPQSTQPTWGCAYEAPTPQMQYTAKSFSKPLAKFFSFILIEKKKANEVIGHEVFPTAKKYQTYYLDWVEFRCLRPLFIGIHYGVRAFQFIQNGRIQSYIIYGIVFILAIFCISIFVK